MDLGFKQDKEISILDAVKINKAQILYSSLFYPY